MNNLSQEDLPQKTNGFLSPPQIKREQGGVLVRATYSKDAFDSSLFDTLGIVRPVQLSAAIDKRQAEFLAGRCMAAIAQNTLGFAARPILIASSRSPIWPNGQAGSISHSRGHCACFLGPQDIGSPGVDIEVVPPFGALKAIENRALNSEDHAEAQRSTLPFDVTLTLIFSAKETLFKALFPIVQHHFGFQAAALEEPPYQDRVILRLTKDLHPTLTKGTRFRICYETDNVTVMTWMLYENI